MKRTLAITFFAASLAAASTRPAHAVVDGREVLLAASTVTGGPTIGARGEIDTTLPEAITFKAKGQPDLTIFYARISTFEQQERNTHRLGFLPALAAGLVAARLHDHFLIVTFHDSADKTQVVRFEVSKEEGENLKAVLDGKSCAHSEDRNCHIAAVRPAMPSPQQRVVARPFPTPREGSSGPAE